MLTVEHLNLLSQQDTGIRRLSFGGILHPTNYEVAFEHMLYLQPGMTRADLIAKREQMVEDLRSSFNDFIYNVLGEMKEE